MQQIAIYGAGGFAREVAWLVEACNEPGPRYEIVGFIDDDPAVHGSVLNHVPVMSLQEAGVRFPGSQVVAGVGAPKTRELLMEKAATNGFEFGTLIHPRVEHSRWIEFGEGAVICAGTILTTNIRLGRHVQINIDCTVGHDALLGDYTTLAPGVHISGWVHLGKRVYIGTGAVIINGTAEKPIQIGDDAVIGAGACVTKSVPPETTVVGVPAKPLQR